MFSDLIKTPKRFGWLPERPDERDWRLNNFAMSHTRSLLPIKNPADRMAEAFSRVLPPDDQGYTGSCVGWAGGTIYSFAHDVARRSALQLYFYARLMIGPEFAKIDSGCHIRDAMKFMANYGIGRDDYWPNIETKFAVPPPNHANIDGYRRRKGSYVGIVTPDEMNRCTMDEATPFVIGATVYANWGNRAAYDFGIIGMPSGSDLGGHAFTVLPGGYIEDFHSHPQAIAAMSAGIPKTSIPKRVRRCRNSWGIEWGAPSNNQGARGDFYIAADYIENLSLADDGWSYRLPMD